MHTFLLFVKCYRCIFLGQFLIVLKAVLLHGLEMAIVISLAITLNVNGMVVTALLIILSCLSMGLDFNKNLLLQVFLIWKRKVIFFFYILCGVIRWIFSILYFWKYFFTSGIIINLLVIDWMDSWIVVIDFQFSMFLQFLCITQCD